tara:strand:+ start:220 stop:618 length:399 start_codon:yes stop_codon:yes gene_type:complete
MFSLFFLLGVASAEPEFTKLEKGEPAPWAGRLFNDEAVAKFIVEDKFKIEQCEIQTMYEVQKLKSSLDLEYSKKIIELESQITVLDQKVILRDDRIKNLEKIKTPPNAFLWATAGFITGAGITVGITYAVNQ